MHHHARRRRPVALAASCVARHARRTRGAWLEHELVVERVRVKPDDAAKVEAMLERLALRPLVAVQPVAAQIERPDKRSGRRHGAQMLPAANALSKPCYEPYAENCIGAKRVFWFTSWNTI